MILCFMCSIFYKFYCCWFNPSLQTASVRRMCCHA